MASKRYFNKLTTGFTFAQNILRILEFVFQLEERKMRLDALTEQTDTKNIHNGWIQLSKVSPNKSDLCRFYKLVSSDDPQRFETSQVHYILSTLDDIKDSIYSTTGITSNAISSILLSKPYYVKSGKVDTCLCEKCENMNELIKCVTSNKEKLSKPYIKMWAVDRGVRRKSFL